MINAPRMHEPSGGIASLPDQQPCRHDQGVAAVYAGGELMRYTCANWRCRATWPPGMLPAGTVVRDDGQEG